MEPLALKIYMMFLTEGRFNKISGFILFGILGIFSVGMGWQFLDYSRLSETMHLGKGTDLCLTPLYFSVLISSTEDLNV